MDDNRILARINDAAQAIAVSRRQFYVLTKTNPDIAGCIVRIPGMRGTFVHMGRLREVIERMAPEKAA